MTSKGKFPNKIKQDLPFLRLEFLENLDFIRRESVLDRHKLGSSKALF
jgi:hypothetical protein